MYQSDMRELAKKLVSKGKGILAADESVNTIAKRFDAVGLENVEENRRAYREMLFTSPGAEKYLSGVIMFEETLKQSTKDGVLFVKLLQEKGIVPGIKVDKGIVILDDSSKEKITSGIEDLSERLVGYYKLGARFAKWRAVITIGDGLPSEKCVKANAELLAQYAKICQDNDIVPIVEPEVLMDGNHTIEKCFEVTKRVLKEVFLKLNSHGVDLESMLLKPNMVINGLEGVKVTSEEIAKRTLECFKEVVPKEVPGIVFLSGGQEEIEACANLDAINKLGKDGLWKLSFSYGRALQNSALKTWGGKQQNVKKAQEVFVHRAKMASMASCGLYDKEMENLGLK